MNPGTTTFQCADCGMHYQDSVEKAIIRKRAFPCGQPCSCGGRFCMHVDGVPVSKDPQPRGGEKD